MVLDGKSDGEISQALKMRRQTINEWRNHNAEFRLELKVKREQVWERQQEKLSKAVEKALDLLIPYLEHEDEKTRLMVALYLLNLPATQANLKMKEVINLKGMLQKIEKTSTNVAIKVIKEGK